MGVSSCFWSICFENYAASGGMNGYISDKSDWPVEIYSPIVGMQTILKNEIISIFYKSPPYHSHLPRLPDGVILPGKSLTKQDTLCPRYLWHETTVSTRVSSRRPIPKSISGPQLAKLAYRLVCQCNSTKQQDSQECTEPVFLEDADRMAKMTTEVQSRKRKWNKGSKNCVDNDNRSKATKKRKGDDLANNNGEKLESFICLEEGGGHGDKAGAEVEEIIREIKSKKRKRRSRRKHDNHSGVLDNGVDELESSILEQKRGDGDHVGLDGKNVDNDNDNRSKATKERKGDDHANNVEKLEFFIPQGEGGGHGDKAGAEVEEIIREIKSKKRKRRSKRRKHHNHSGVLDNGVDELESSILEQKRGDGDHVGLEGKNVETQAKSKNRYTSQSEEHGVRDNDVENLNSCNNANKLDKGIPLEHRHDGIRVNADGLVDTKPEVKSKRRRRRSKNFKTDVIGCV